MLQWIIVVTRFHKHKLLITLLGLLTVRRAIKSYVRNPMQSSITFLLALLTSRRLVLSITLCCFRRPSLWLFFLCHSSSYIRKAAGPCGHGTTYYRDHIIKKGFPDILNARLAATVCIRRQKRAIPLEVL